MAELGESLKSGGAEMCEEVSDKDTENADVEQNREKCLVVVGADINGSISSDVYAVQVQNSFKVVQMGAIDVTFTSAGRSCVHKNTLYVTGISEHYDQIRSLSLDTRQAIQCARLIIPRKRHSTIADSDGNIYFLGGWKGDSTGHLYSVEKYNISSGESKEVDGHLPFNDCYQCSSCFVAGKIILCGTMDSDGYQQIIVWDTATCRTEHTIPIQSQTESNVFGVDVFQGHLVVIAEYYTAIGLVDDILSGRKDRIKLSEHYQSPNDWCGLITSANDQTVYLVGGLPELGEPQHYIYQASVSDLIQDTAKGWTPVTGTDWSLGECKLYTGAATVYIKL